MYFLKPLIIIQTLLSVILLEDFGFVVLFATTWRRIFKKDWEPSCFRVCVCVCVSCSVVATLCDPMDCSLPGSLSHGILQARILEWIAISFSRGSSQAKDQTQISCIAGRFFTVWIIKEAHFHV